MLFTNNIKTLAVIVIEFITLKAEASLNIVFFWYWGCMQGRKDRRAKSLFSWPDLRKKQRDDNAEEY